MLSEFVLRFFLSCYKVVRVALQSEMYAFFYASEAMQRDPEFASIAARPVVYFSGSRVDVDPGSLFALIFLSVGLSLRLCVSSLFLLTFCYGLTTDFQVDLFRTKYQRELDHCRAVKLALGPQVQLTS